MKRIDPDEQYAFSEARLLIKSSRGGPVALKTLHDWRRAGLITCEFRQLGKLCHWFVTGREILRMRGETWEANAQLETKGAITRTRAQHDRAQAEALRELDRLMGKKEAKK